MKKIFLLVAIGLISNLSIGQELPQPSPLAKTSQIVGLTNIELEYSRPSVKGRTIFGDLVGYDKIWRLGANGCTKFTCNTPVKFESGTLKPGTYALFAIPAKNNAWTFVFNTDTEQWGAGNYDEAKNVLKIKVKAEENSHTESMSITLQDITANSATIQLTWDKIKVDVPFKVETEMNAEKNIAAAIKEGKELETVYFNAGRYYLNTKKDTKKALSNFDKSLKVKETHKALYYKAKVLKEDGKDKDAITVMNKALEVAKKADATSWIAYIEGAIASWEKE